MMKAVLPSVGGGTFVTAPQMRVQGASSLVRSATARSVAWSVDVTASGRTVGSSRSAYGVPPAAAVDRETDRWTDGQTDGQMGVYTHIHQYLLVLYWYLQLFLRHGCNICVYNTRNAMRNMYVRVRVHYVQIA